MKTIVISALALVFVGSNAFAGRMDLNCVGYRVSQDANKNVQQLIVSSDTGGVRLYGEELETVSGEFQSVPADFVVKSKDGKRKYRIVVTSQDNLASFEGHIAIGRDHLVSLTKVAIDVSRNGKTHRFVGTCTEEVVTSCGGGCDEEDPKRDEI
jgi:hypothetical protein